MPLSPIHVEVEGNPYCRHQFKVTDHEPPTFFHIFYGASLTLVHRHCPYCGRLEEHRVQKEEELSIPITR